VDEVLERLFRAADVGCGLLHREEAIHRRAVPTLQLRGDASGDFPSPKPSRSVRQTCVASSIHPPLYYNIMYRCN
jgi:hypothetical protein